MRLFSYIVVITLSYNAYCEDVYTNGIEIDKHLLSPQYWLNKIEDQDAILMTADDIEAYNKNLMKYDEHVKDPFSFPDIIDRMRLKPMIKSVSFAPPTPRFYANGKILRGKDYQRYVDNMYLQSIKIKQEVQFGLVVYRAALRTFPTMDRVSKLDMDFSLDRFQESALFPGEAVVIFLTSKDNQWYFVRNYHICGWVHRDAVALGSRDEVKRYYEAETFVVVTSDKIFTENVQPKSELSKLQLDMGTRFPLLVDDSEESTSHIVLLPVRDDFGNLNFTKLYLPQHKDISIGYLPFTRANIIEQSLKFLGEKYGWGYDYNARDCTGFVGDVYKTFGILMPRNSGEQGSGSYGINLKFSSDNNIDDKMVYIKQLEIGDLVYIPGHVMMYIGSNDDKPYVIHDTKGAGYLTPNGTYHRKQLNGVVITELIPLYLTPNITYVERVYNIKRIRSVEYSCY